MRKTLITLIALLVSAVIVSTQAQDVVYLKNGSIIKGAIVEHVPNSAVKIQTANGSLYVFQMDEVEKMTFDRNNDYNKRYDPRNWTEEMVPTGDYLKKGLRMFIEFGADVVVSDYYNDYSGNTSMPFTIGYQVNRMLFVGGGIAPGIAIGDNYYYYDYDYYYDDYYYRPAYNARFLMPIYAAVRCDFLNSRISPFIDVRGGYTVTDFCRGGYANFNLGCRISHFNLSIGYTYQGSKDYDKGFGLATFRLGYEF